MNFNFSENVFLAAGQTSPEDALAAGNYPASGSYVDVSNYQGVNIVVHMGAIHASDTPTVEIKQTDAVDGTLDTLDATNCKKVFAAADDDQVGVFYIDTDTLADDHHFLSAVVSLVTNGSYGDIVYFCCGPKKAPVTQTTALLPSDNQFEKV